MFFYDKVSGETTKLDTYIKCVLPSIEVMHVIFVKHFKTVQLFDIPMVLISSSQVYGEIEGGKEFDDLKPMS